MPSEITANVKVPDNFEIPLVYRGGPIPVQMDIKNLTGSTDDDTPCFAIIPCAKK